MACASTSTKIPGTDIEEKAFDLNIEQKKASSRSFEALNKEVDSLNKYIGSYPPRFNNEEERQTIYQSWLDLVSDAEAYARESPETEKGLYIMSELYRQGHNMDVKGSAEKALERLNTCLSLFPQSIACNFSASYFYLSIGPKYLDSAEKSLHILRGHFAPKLNSEVEGGYVFLFLYRQDVPKAKDQIDKFIKSFPNSRRAKDFANIKAGLGDKIEWKEQ